MIRKLGKARWTYTCEPCEIGVTFPDQFRAIEYRQRHERNLGHAFKPLVNAFREMAKILGGGK